MAMYRWSDMSEVYLHTMDGERIGTARPTEALHPLARLFGDELDLIKVQEANKRQRQLKSATMKLVKDFDAEVGESGLQTLPWMRQESVPLKAVPMPKKAAEEPVIDEAEIARLEAVRAKIKALPTNTLKRPAFFASEYERYEWCFQQSVVNGFVLPEEDHEFMARYEESDEYRTATGGRFEQLRAFYKKQGIAR
jgi:putative transposase